MIQVTEDYNSINPNWTLLNFYTLNTHHGSCFTDNMDFWGKRGVESAKFKFLHSVGTIYNMLSKRKLASPCCYDKIIMIARIQLQPCDQNQNTLYETLTPQTCHFSTFQSFQQFIEYCLQT
jgi:hypothetical protein